MVDLMNLSAANPISGCLSNVLDGQEVVVRFHYRPTIRVTACVS
ncbi:hypothetical protein [Amycolatopsis ultiminotia]